MSERIRLPPVLVSFLNALPSSYHSRYGTAVANAPAGPEPPLLTEADLSPLPEPVAAYLRYAGSVGKPRVLDFQAHFRGRIRAKPGGPWLPFHADQTSFYAPRARLFLLHSSLYGLPFDAFHRYADGQATMEVKVASLFRIVNASGPEMNVSETVTMLNDMCVLAPATLIDPSIRWERLGPRAVNATFENAGNSVSANLFFNERAELVNFESDDRYQTSDGKAYTRYRWSTPLGDYREFDGRRLASRGDATWSMPDGELVYGRFELVSLSVNTKR